MTKGSRIVAKSAGGNMPYATDALSTFGNLRRSGPGHTNSFHSDSTTQDIDPSKWSRLLIWAGISTVGVPASGGEW